MFVYQTYCKVPHPIFMFNWTRASSSGCLTHFCNTRAMIKLIDELARTIKRKVPDPGKGRPRILTRATLEDILGEHLDG